MEFVINTKIFKMRTTYPAEPQVHTCSGVIDLFYLESIICLLNKGRTVI